MKYIIGICSALIFFVGIYDVATSTETRVYTSKTYSLGLSDKSKSDYIEIQSLSSHYAVVTYHNNKSNKSVSGVFSVKHEDRIIEVKVETDKNEYSRAETITVIPPNGWWVYPNQIEVIDGENTYFEVIFQGS